MKPDQVIECVEQVTSNWLTDVLTKSGALTAGKVTQFEAEAGGGHWSKNAKLQLTYSNDSAGERPIYLFLKLVNTDLGDGEFFLSAEVNYYTRDYIELPEAPLVCCYTAAYDPSKHSYHLLLADVSATHKPAYDMIPTLEYGKALAEGLAILHAHWWGANRLQELNVIFHDTRHLTRAATIGREGIKFVNSIFGDRLKSHWPALIDQIYDQLPASISKHGQDRSNFTLIHGDPNPGNILVPHEGVRPIYFIDQQPFDWSITVWHGVYDLAYIMALYWPSNLRRELEVPVLQHYLAKLQERGVKEYSWEQLYEDYRLAVLIMVPIAVEYMADGGDPDWNDFRYGLVQHTLTACDDLKCNELLF